MYTKFNDLTGQRFGKLTVISRATRPGVKIRWLCQCDCGNAKTIEAGNLGTNTHSCGCIRNTQGGMTRAHPLWRRWSNMVERCTKPTCKDFHNYGGRGIQVCDRWLHFPNFVADMQATHFDGASIERKDNERGYSPDNCAWETTKAQGRNKRTNHVISSPWGVITIAEAAERMGIRQGAFKSRIKDEWTYEELFDPRYARKLHKSRGRLRS